MRIKLENGLWTSTKSNSYFKYFIFFLAWPFVKIGVSITFYLFLFLWYSLKKERKEISLKPSKSSYLFYAFLITAALSLAFAPWDELQSFNYGDAFLFIQYFYWMMIAVFFTKFY